MQVTKTQLLLITPIADKATDVVFIRFSNKFNREYEHNEDLIQSRFNHVTNTPNLTKK